MRLALDHTCCCLCMPLGSVPSPFLPFIQYEYQTQLYECRYHDYMELPGGGSAMNVIMKSQVMVYIFYESS